MRDAVAMWRNTRLVVLTAVSASLYAALLIPFKVLPLIPGVTELRPANAVPVVCSFLFGPAGAWGAAIGNLIGDFFGGIGPGDLFGFAGNFLYGFLPYTAWRALSGADPLPRTAPQWVAFVGVVALAAGACGLIIGWGLNGGQRRSFPSTSICCVSSGARACRSATRHRHSGAFPAVWHDASSAKIWVRASCGRRRSGLVGALDCVTRSGSTDAYPRARAVSFNAYVMLPARKATAPSRHASVPCPATSGHSSWKSNRDTVRCCPRGISAIGSVTWPDDPPQPARTQTTPAMMWTPRTRCLSHLHIRLARPEHKRRPEGRKPV